MPLEVLSVCHFIPVPRLSLQAGLTCSPRLAWLHLLNLAPRSSHIHWSPPLLFLMWYQSWYQSSESCKNHNWLQRMLVRRSTSRICASAHFQSSFATLVTCQSPYTALPTHLIRPATNLLQRLLQLESDEGPGPISIPICRVGGKRRPHRDVGYIYVKYITLMHIHFFLKLIIFSEMC